MWVLITFSYMTKSQKLNNYPCSKKFFLAYILNFQMRSNVNFCKKNLGLPMALIVILVYIFC